MLPGAQKPTATRHTPGWMRPAGRTKKKAAPPVTTEQLFPRDFQPHTSKLQLTGTLQILYAIYQIRSGSAPVVVDACVAATAPSAGLILLPTRA